MRTAAGRACNADEGAGQPRPAADPVPALAGKARVGELEALLGIVQPTLSQQLTVLREQGLVSTRREGKNIFYALTSPRRWP
jgi:DNA-binding transcriptional ArsR family regulator